MPTRINKYQKLSLLYESAISLKSHEGSLIWSRFSAFMIVNTLVFAMIGLLLENNKTIYIPIISIIGLILTSLWFLSTMRGFEAIEYWNSSIREIEERMLEGEVIPSLYIRGERYFKQNREVEFTFDDPKNPYILQRGCLTRCFHLNTRGTAYISIILILFMYLVILALYFFDWLPSIKSNMS